MNMTAMQWLRKTHHDLIEIVRTEYSVELRDNVQLAQLVPRIALNIDSLLKRYNKGATTNQILSHHDEAVDDATINKTWGSGEKNSFQGNRGEQYVDNPHVVGLLQLQAEAQSVAWA